MKDAIESYEPLEALQRALEKHHPHRPGLLLDFDEIARHGKMTLEESKVAKAYGIYTTRHPNYFMARIVVPGGVLTTSQVRGLAKSIEASPRACIHPLTRLFTDDDGAPTGHIKAAAAPDATYIWIESDQCIRCGNCNRACPTYAIPIRKADIDYGPVKSE